MWRAHARPMSLLRHRPAMRIRITGRSARSCPRCSEISFTSPMRSRNGTATWAVRPCMSRSRPSTAQRKVELLHKCYPSQRARDWWDDEVFLGMARLRGIECRAPYAEAFTCTKSVIVPAAFARGDAQ